MAFVEVLDTGAGGLWVKTPYNRDFVDRLKSAVPSAERRYDPAQRAWVVDAAHGPTVQRLIRAHFSVDVALPTVTAQTAPVMRLLDCRYIGQCKIREDGLSTAYGWVGGRWYAVFPEQALRDWFEGGASVHAPQQPDQPATLYAALGIRQSATPDEIKSAFRRMARQWHPDVCKEPNAADMFRRIKEAADVLSNPALRARYDAGLALEASLKTDSPRQVDITLSYRSPLRCGLIAVEGRETIGRFVVEKILAWEDITNEYGLTLVSSWPMGATVPEEQWV